MMWPALSVAFLVGVLTGAVAVFIWVAETLVPAIDRIERAEQRKMEYWVRRDDAARNDYRSEL